MNIRYYLMLVALVGVISLSVVSAPGLRAHNVYSSFSQIDWNESDNSIELVVQIHSHELEEKLSLLLDKRLSFLNDEDFRELETATGSYLRSNINLMLDDTPLDLIFLGIETDGQTVVAYLEQDWPQAPTSIDFMNQIFLADLAGQINSVLATVNGTRQGGDINWDTGPLRFTF